MTHTDNSVGDQAVIYAELHWVRLEPAMEPGRLRGRLIGGPSSTAYGTKCFLPDGREFGAHRRRDEVLPCRVVAWKGGVAIVEPAFGGVPPEQTWPRTLRESMVVYRAGLSDRLKEIDAATLLDQSVRLRDDSLTQRLAGSDAALVLLLAEEVGRRLMAGSTDERLQTARYNLREASN